MDFTTIWNSRISKNTWFKTKKEMTARIFLQNITKNKWTKWKMKYDYWKNNFLFHLIDRDIYHAEADIGTNGYHLKLAHLYIDNIPFHFTDIINISYSFIYLFILIFFGDFIILIKKKYFIISLNIYVRWMSL